MLTVTFYDPPSTPFLPTAVTPLTESQFAPPEATQISRSSINFGIEERLPSVLSRPVRPSSE